MRWLFLIIFILSFFSKSYAAQYRYQFNFNVGTDNPESTDTRSGGASLVRFAISNRPRVFRFVGGFTIMSGGGLKQGEFAVGPHIYPFSNVPHTPVQPYVGAEGTFGIGTFNDKLRYDTGYGLILGCDFQFWSRSGLTIAIEQHNATETAFRMWIGFQYRGK